jgi:DNA-binding response OmpR family regulator
MMQDMEHTKSKKVLIVEDDKMLSGALKDYLDKRGFTTQVAEDGEEGLRAFYADTFDAVVLDIIMPKKDGIAMLSEVYAKDPQCKSLFIVLSNADDLDHISDAMLHHATTYIVKSDRSLEDIANTIEQKLALGH